MPVPDQAHSAEPDPETVAYHESGHAYAAHWLGARVRIVSIDPESDDDRPRSGETRIDWQRGKWTECELRLKGIQIALAGPVAEMLYTGDPYHPGFIAAWRDDWRTAWELATPLFPVERQRLATLEDLTRSLYQSLDQHPHWDAVAAIADRLLAEDSLDREEFLDTIEPWSAAE
jgi:hypothetical protein